MHNMPVHMSLKYKGTQKCHWDYDQHIYIYIYINKCIYIYIYISQDNILTTCLGGGREILEIFTHIYLQT